MKIILFMTKARLFKPFAIFLFSLLTTPCWADNISVAVASNFIEPMQSLAAAFQQSTGHTVTVSSGASGQFYAQIKHGAPFHILLSADQDKPAQLERDGLGIAGTRFTYAIGKLVLWSPKPNLVDSQAQVLMQHHFGKLAMANPDLAPYGQAAVQVLGALKLRDSLQDKIVLGENIGQAYLFVASGQADLGFVGLSQIMHHGTLSSGSVWMIPAGLYRPIKQDAVLLQAGQNSQAAQQFLAYLKTDPARRLISSYGYSFP